MASRRIPVQRTQAFARWSLPVVGADQVLKAEAVRATRNAPQAEATAQPAPRESLERQLVANIRAGHYAPGISASQVEAIVHDAAREGREEGFAAGFAKGEQDGFARGREDGLAAGRGLIEDAAGRLAAMLHALQQPLENQQEELREALLALIGRIAGAVIRAELRLQPETIRMVVTEALAAMPLGAANIRVRVSPADLELLHTLPETPREWPLVADPALGRGDCRIEASESVVDYTVSARLEELLAQLLGGAMPDAPR
jgi:flagellar assembly protein FliH